MNFTILSRFNLFFAALLLPLLSLANVDIIKVKAEGVGSSLNEAVDKALVQAISMVNGKSIESETLLKTKSQSKSTNEGSEFSNEKEMQDEIKSRTNGIVDGYKILDQSKTQSGNVKVKLEVKIAKFKLPKSAKRKKIAVIDFIPRQSCCSFKQADLNGDAVSNVLTDAVNNYLVQTRKFTVLDRNYQNLITGEKSRLTQGNVPMNQLVKLGQELVADFLLVGTLNSLRLNEKEIKLKTTDKVIKRSIGSLSLNFRIIDVATGQVKFSQNLNVNLAGVVNLSNGTDVALQEAVQETAKKAGYKILEAIYPFVVESINGEVLTIGTGGDLIKVGQKFKLIQYGSKIIDSYTKESLGRREVQIGTIEITEVTSKMSYAKIVNLSKKDALNDFKPKSFIIRSLPERAKKDLKKQQEDLRKNLDKEFDDGW